MIQLGLATSSPSLEWAIASSPNARWNPIQMAQQLR
jgi:hypothetical protein